jgi:thioesterase domain-containing protein
VTSKAKVGSLRIAVLSGAGGGVPDLRALAATPAEADGFSPVIYPGWRRYTDVGFDVQALIDDLACEIAGWGGRVVILGFSLGGHLGYAIALKLQSLGVEVAGLCAIDSFLVSSADIRPGSAGRHFAHLRALTQRHSLGRLAGEVRQLVWRALIRMAGDRTTPWARRGRDSAWMRAVCAVDPLFEKELDMRLLMGATAPWLGQLDRHPVPLRIPAAHLRTAAAADADAVWRARCPDIDFVDIPGSHGLLFAPENFTQVRRAFLSTTQNWR